MTNRLLSYLRDIRDRQRIAIALSKGAATMHARRIDLTQPSSWEFSGFSQNGEDGVLDVLRSQLLRSDRYFVEIGAADGIENNTAWLLVAEKYSGVTFEGDPALVERARRVVAGYSIGAECHHMFVTLERAKELTSMLLYPQPDVFSLDIDGNDYHIARAILESGVRPKIAVVEYNSVYGPERKATIEYQPDFDFREAHPTQLYYGVSVCAWRALFEAHGYRFVTVERNGVNAFFVDPAHFERSFLDAIRGLGFAPNRYQAMKFRKTDAEQFALIADRKIVHV